MCNVSVLIDVCMQMISIFGHPENCSSACKEILNVIHNELAVQSRGGSVYYIPMC